MQMIFSRNNSVTLRNKNYFTAPQQKCWKSNKNMTAEKKHSEPLDDQLGDNIYLS